MGGIWGVFCSRGREDKGVVSKDIPVNHCQNIGQLHGVFCDYAGSSHSGMEYGARMAMCNMRLDGRRGGNDSPRRRGLLGLHGVSCSKGGAWGKNDERNGKECVQ